MPDLLSVLLSVIGALLTIGWGILAYTLRQMAIEVKETAQAVKQEKEKTDLALERETEKLARSFENNHKELERQLVAFRVEVAKEYTTTTLLREITVPIFRKLEAIEQLLATKLDRHEYEKHLELRNGK